MCRAAHCDSEAPRDGLGCRMGRVWATNRSEALPAAASAPLARRHGRRRGGEGGGSRLFFVGLDRLELADAAGGVPVHDVDVALAVERDAVRRGEDAGLPLVRRDVVVGALLEVGVVAEVGDFLVVL